MIRTRCPNCGAKYSTPGELPERLKCEHCGVTFFPQPVDEIPDEPPEETLVVVVAAPAAPHAGARRVPTPAPAPLSSLLSATEPAEPVEPPKPAEPAKPVASPAPPEAAAPHETPPVDDSSAGPAEADDPAPDHDAEEIHSSGDESHDAHDEDHEPAADEPASPAGKKSGNASKPRPKWLRPQPKRRTAPAWLQNFLQSRSKAPPRRGAAPPKPIVTTTQPPAGDVGRLVVETATPLKSLSSLIVDEADGALPESAASPEPEETYGLASSAQGEAPAPAAKSASQTSVANSSAAALAVAPSSADEDTQDLATPAPPTSNPPTSSEPPAPSATKARPRKGSSRVPASVASLGAGRKSSTAFLMACGYVAGVATSLAAVLLFRLSFGVVAPPPVAPVPAAPAVSPTNRPEGQPSQSWRPRPTIRTAGATPRPVN